MKTRSISCLLPASVLALTAIAQPTASTFTSTAEMTTRRIFHTSTLLADGRVLIAGGDMIESQAASSSPPPFKTQSSAELYDPRTGTFAPTGSMTTPRSGHTATLLPDGTVLIAGGGITNAAIGVLADPTLMSAEVYDPGTGTFSATHDMNTARAFHKAVLLSDGTLLIAGGIQRQAEQPVTLASAEIYDSSSGMFSATGDMTSFADTATLLPNGKVLITRGDPDGGAPYLSSADLYDPATRQFAYVGYLNAHHSAPTATLLLNGKVLIAGGDVGDGDGASVVAELYDSATDAFIRTGSLITGREQHTATLLADGTVLFAGGHTVPDTSAEIYDPVKETFFATGSLNIGRELQEATLLKDGTVLITGGDDQLYWIPETILANAEIYNSAFLPAPTLFSLSGDGQGQGAIWDALSGQIASPTHPAVAGEALTMYTSSLGGGVIPPQVAVGGRVAQVLYFGAAPGYPGYSQVNFIVPAGVAPGPAVPVRLTYLDRPSKTVTIGLQ